MGLVGRVLGIAAVLCFLAVSLVQNLSEVAVVCPAACNFARVSRLSVLLFVVAAAFDVATIVFGLFQLHVSSNPQKYRTSEHVAPPRGPFLRAGVLMTFAGIFGVLAPAVIITAVLVSGNALKFADAAAIVTFLYMGAVHFVVAISEKLETLRLAGREDDGLTVRGCIGECMMC